MSSTGSLSSTTRNTTTSDRSPSTTTATWLSIRSSSSATRRGANYLKTISFPTKKKQYQINTDFVPTSTLKPRVRKQHVHEPGMPFDFNYAVNDAESANDYNHNAVSDGDVTRGEYRVQLPDGRTQIVKYTADWKNGYNAEVCVGMWSPTRNILWSFHDCVFLKSVWPRKQTLGDDDGFNFYYSNRNHEKKQELYDS